jgi:hypothetical protein
MDCTIGTFGPGAWDYYAAYGSAIDLSTSSTWGFALDQKLLSDGLPLLADCVEKLENRGAPKISQM